VASGTCGKDHGAETDDLRSGVEALEEAGRVSELVGVEGFARSSVEIGCSAREESAARNELAHVRARLTIQATIWDAKMTRPTPKTPDIM
jgi:hypothetical protein